VDAPQYDRLINEQIEEATKKRGKGDLEALFNSGETWTVN
jgi:2-oxoglutarate ferredoxin oxidoreductase subunit beta